MNSGANGRSARLLLPSPGFGRRGRGAHGGGGACENYRKMGCGDDGSDYDDGSNYDDDGNNNDENAYDDGKNNDGNGYDDDRCDYEE